jgi:hypothetical protein
MEKIDASSVIDEVAKVTDHPYLSAMIIKERFPEYVNIDEIVSIVQEHHLPIDKSGSICAQALKAADQRARREEIKRWFIKTYGSEAKSVDPYLNLTIGWDIEQTIKQTPDGQSEQITRAKQTRQSNQTIRSDQTSKPRQSEIEPIMTAVYRDEGLLDNDSGSAETQSDRRNDDNEDEGIDGEREIWEFSERTMIDMPLIFAGGYDEGDRRGSAGDQAGNDGGSFDRQTDQNGQSGERSSIETTAAEESKSGGDNNQGYDDDGNKSSIAAATNNKAKPKAKPAKSKNRFGETKTPKYPQSDDYRTLEFDLPSCETTILDRLRDEPIVIERGGSNAFVPSLNIVSIPYSDCLLVSFGRIAGLIGSLFENDRESGEIEYGAMTRYAVNEWRKRSIVLFVGEGYTTRKYEYLYNGEQRKIVNLIPFSIDALGLNAGDLLERAKSHPLYSLIGEMRMGR